MAVTHGRHADVYLNGYDLTGILNKAASPFKQDIHPTPMFGKDAIPKIYGHEDHAVKLEGWLDNATGLPAVLSDAMGAAGYAYGSHAPDGDAFGNYAQAFMGVGGDYEEASEDAPNKIVAGFESTVGWERVLIHHALAAVTGDVTGTGIDAGASSTVECAAYAFVHAYSGFTNVVVKIQHSADGSSWADLVTFTTITAARTCERKVVDAGTTVQRHTRVLIDVTGTGSAEVFVGFGRKQ
jgi:hypothetical protein